MGSTMRLHSGKRSCSILLFLLALAACSQNSEIQPATLSGAMAQEPAPAPSVTVAQVVVKNITPVQPFIGHVIPIQAVQVVPRVTAFIDNIPVKQGSNVKTGQVLYQLQKAQFEAAVQAAQAQLASAKAALWQAQLAFDRASRLNQKGFEAQAVLDQAQATRDQDQAAVQAAQASLDQAQLNLSYCTISSPIDGRIGAITLTKGNLVTPSTPPLATVNQLDPIRVVFSVSDRVIISANKKNPENRIAPGLAVNLELPDGSAYGQTGKINFLDNRVDPQTGTVSVFADFANPAAQLLPGANVTIKVQPAKAETALLVPIEAVQSEQAGRYVLVVGPGNKIEQRTVQLGHQIDQDFIVEKGLSAGDRVVISGAQKVHRGEIVNPVSGQSAAQESAPGGQTSGPGPDR
jgi:membrane fusion protein (multidrug efflux system)